MKSRLDNELVKRALVSTRSQAESYIKLGKVIVNGKAITKSGYFVDKNADIELNQTEQYVSRAGLKLASVAKALSLNFKNKIILDVGSSTGGFTDYSLKHGAQKVIAVDVGTAQLHPSLRGNSSIELYEKTNILDINRWTLVDGGNKTSNFQKLSSNVDIVLIDVSFISLRQILPHICTLCTNQTQVVAMFKPQFETGNSLMHKGVIKNDSMRRAILRDFEVWVKNYFVIKDKTDSQITGAKGNLERFYLLKLLTKAQ
ncbi:MAG: TlyA family RNA methyltransferase [Candidatus Saccharibacteria bacterium]